MKKKRVLTHKEMLSLVQKVVSDCKKIAENYVSTWTPFHKKWDTIEGCVYLRLSDPSQVAVERGSL